jgi:hypothetical protein
MKRTWPSKWVPAGILIVLIGTGVASGSAQHETAKEAVSKVFAKYPEGEQVWPLSEKPVYARVRPLRQSSFEALRRYFSVRRQANVDQFLRALADLVSARDQLAKSRGIVAKWWWPTTDIDRLKVDAVMSRDLLTDRSDNPDETIISKPKVLDGKLELTVKELFTEIGQDRVLGKGKKTSIVGLISESGHWVIDEIASTTVDAYGDTHVDTLSQLLQDATKTLRETEQAIKKLPQKLEVRKGQALRQGSQHEP